LLGLGPNGTIDQQQRRPSWQLIWAAPIWSNKSTVSLFAEKNWIFAGKDELVDSMAKLGEKSFEWKV
jgi:hypothetical protein